MLTIVKLWLSKTFLMKDMGDASYVLGIKIYRDRSRRLIGLSQSLYVDKVLVRYRMEQSKKGYLPVRHGIHLSKSMSPKTPEEVNQMSNIPYASAIRSLMTKDMFLVYGESSELLVKGYTDSDFEFDVDDQKSTYGYMFTLNGGQSVGDVPIRALLWTSQLKQSI
ncbi:unnamed protein product [Prunus brigantina]